MYFTILFCFSLLYFLVRLLWGWAHFEQREVGETTLPRREIGSFNGLVPSRLKTEEVLRIGVKMP